MHGRLDLMALFWTTAGIFPGDGEISRFDFVDRVEAAARAGFSGIGLWHTDLEHVMAGRSLAEMKSILDANGIRHLELEFLTDWFAHGARKGESDSRRKRLLEASAALGASHVKVGDFYNTPCTPRQIADAFGALCEEARRYGATIGFEIMECAAIDTIPAALSMLRDSGAPNGGLIIDAVQVANLGMTEDALRSIPLRSLVSVELDDGLLPGSPGHDPSARRFCGEGEFDLAGLIRCVDAMGYDRPWAVEVFNRSYAGLPLEDLARRAFTTTAAALEHARRQ